MDSATVAAEVTPFIIKAAESLGKKVWDKTSDAAVDEAAGFGRRLLMRLTGRTGSTDALRSTNAEIADSGGELAVVGAVNDFLAMPANPDAQAALRLVVYKLLAADPDLMAAVAQLVERERPRLHVGDRSITIEGSQSGGLNITGDRNRIDRG